MLKNQFLLEYSYITICVSFCCTAKGISCVYPYIPLFWISFPLRSPRSRGPCAVQEALMFPILCIVSVVYTCQAQSPNSSHTHFSPWYPYICSLCLCLYYCFADKINLYSFSRFRMYALIYGICFSLSDLLHSL